jgi:hypothetical protein
VLAHIPVRFLAHVLWKTLEQWQSRAGLGNSPRTILQELAAKQTDVVLPTATLPQRELRLRCVVRPNRAQAALPAALNAIRAAGGDRVQPGARRSQCSSVHLTRQSTGVHGASAPDPDLAIDGVSGGRIKRRPP